MLIRVQTQETPNPNALKFILNTEVIEDGKMSYTRESDFRNNVLAERLFEKDYVEEVHFFENVLTITKSDEKPWSDVENDIVDSIYRNIGMHNPAFDKSAPTFKRKLTKEMLEIETILDNTIRPGLQGDGGDLDVMAYEDNVLTIAYQGACGSCPSSTMGTLMAIQDILRTEYNPEIIVETM
jgi:Fe-S cluster biogenesis protein NfuA